MDIDRIFTHFTAMSGVDDGEALRPLCESAAHYLRSRLRDGGCLLHCERLCLAAAAFAFADWIELGGFVSSAREVRVGDITLRENSANVAAPDPDQIRAQALDRISDLLAPRFVLSAIEDPT